MKSSRIFFIVLFSFFYPGLKAQLFVGGNFGINTSGTKVEFGNSTSNSSDYNISISPFAGKFLSEKVAVGLALDISLSGSTTGLNPVPKTDTHKTYGQENFS